MAEARPARASKRPGGKSDPTDAARAARDALTADKLARPRADGEREALRILLAGREQATTARTAAVNTFKALILGAPTIYGSASRPEHTQSSQQVPQPASACQAASRRADPARRAAPSGHPHRCPRQ